MLMAVKWLTQLTMRSMIVEIASSRITEGVLAAIVEAEAMAAKMKAVM